MNENNIIFVDNSTNTTIENFDKFFNKELSLYEKNITNSVIDLFYTKENDRLRNELIIQFNLKNCKKERKCITLFIENDYGKCLIDINLFYMPNWVYESHFKEKEEKFLNSDQFHYKKEDIEQGSLTFVRFPSFNKQIKKGSRSRWKTMKLRNSFYTCFLHFDPRLSINIIKEIALEHIEFLPFLNRQSLELFLNSTSFDKRNGKIEYNEILYQDENFIIKKDIE